MHACLYVCVCVYFLEDLFKISFLFGEFKLATNQVARLFRSSYGKDWESLWSFEFIDMREYAYLCS